MEQSMGAIEVCIEYSDTSIVFAVRGIGRIAANVIAGFLRGPNSLILVRGGTCIMVFVCRFVLDGERYDNHTLRRRLC